MSHTPGPWTLSDIYLDDEGLPEIAVRALVEGKPCYPAAVCLQFPAAHGMQMANARLIAAAPMLLNALRGVLRVADRATDEFDAARAAIAAATGCNP